MGLVIAAVLAAAAYENTAGVALLDRVAAQTGRVTKALVDQGFVLQVKRWVVERTYGILMLRRRLVRDHESRPVTRSPAWTG